MQGNPYLLSSYNAAVGGTMVNQVQRTFNGLGQLTVEYQSHGGAVNTATTPKVQYAYSALDTSNRSRLTSMTYPNGRVVGYNYTTGLDSTISRLSSITDSGVTLESYSYLGLGTVVVRAHPQNSVDLAYVKLAGEAVGDAGDQYTGLDRFGRIVDQRWQAGGVDQDRNKYTYDRDGNRLTKGNSVNSAFNEVYTYDGLNQVASFNRGSGARTQSFDYDALGNRDGVTTNGSTQTYTANRQNEITSISGATTPTYDANGNMTGDETGKQFVYDAWNRLVAVKNSGGTVLKTYGYDSLNHRVSETVSGTTTDLYYSAGWQVLEERVGGVTRVSNVWSPVYVDAMIARDRDTDANGTLDERLYATHDANFNVTGLVNTSGAVVERYVYDTYGAVTVLNASWTVLGSSAYAWVYLHQGGRVDGVSGLVHFRNRDYSVTLGRFTSVDSSGFGAGDTNLYRAEGNGPTGRLDPSGLSWEDTWDELVSVGEYVLTNPVGTVVNSYAGMGEGAVNLGIGARNTAVEMYYLGRDVGNASIASYSIVANGFGYWDIGYVHTFDYRSNTMRGYDQSVQENNGRLATPYLVRAMLDGASLGTRPMALGVADYAETGDATRSSQTCGGVALTNFVGAGTGVAFGRLFAAPTEGAIHSTRGPTLSGHGEFQTPRGHVTMPEGTSVSVYARTGKPILDTTGGLLDQRILPPATADTLGARTYLPGSSIPDLTLLPPDGLTILGKPTTVSGPTQLSAILKPNMGNIWWSACLLIWK